MVETTGMKDRLLAIGIEAKTVDNILKNAKVMEMFETVLNLSGLKECPKEKGALLYSLTTKGKNLSKETLPHFVKMIVDNKWTRVAQLDAGVEFIKKQTQTIGKEYTITDADTASFD